MPVTDLGTADDPLTNSKQKKNWITNERLFEVADNFYWHLQQDAEMQNGVLVWEVSMSQLFKNNRLTHMYSPVTRVLYAAGCINLASRGGGGKPSLVHLHHAPTLKEVTTLRDSEFFFERDALTGKARERILEQKVKNQGEQIADLLARVERLERG